MEGYTQLRPIDLKSDPHFGLYWLFSPVEGHDIFSEIYKDIIYISEHSSYNSVIDFNGEFDSLSEPRIISQDEIMIDAEPQSSKNIPISALYVDDEEELLTLCKLFLERTGEFRISTIPSAQKALQSPEILDCDVIISDYLMPGMDGISFLKAVREKFGDIPFILFTGRGREEVVIEAINNGADYYLQKGGDPKPLFAELSHKIRQAVRNKKAETAIRESEKTLADIINFLPDATFAIDRNGRIIAWNRAIEDMTGFSSNEMMGKGNYEYAIPFYGLRQPVLIDLVNESDSILNAIYGNITRSDSSITAVTDLLTTKGDILTVFGKSCPLYNHAGEIIGAIESIRDISELKKKEMELVESEEKFRKLVEYSLDPILIVDFSGIILFINHNGLLLTGEDDPEVITGKKNVLEYVHPDSQELVRNDICQVLQGNDAYLSQYRLVSGKNPDIWVESRGKKIPYQQSEAILVSLRDITEQKRIENTLVEREEQFKALTEQSQDIIVRVDRDLQIIYCNPKLTEIAGISVDCLIGTDSRNVIGQEEKTCTWIQAIHRVFTTGHSLREEWKIRDDLWFDCLYYPEIGKEKTVQAVTASLRDITRTKEHEKDREIYYRNLLTQQEFTDALLDAVPLPVQWRDLDGRSLGCNQAFSHFFGVSREEMTNKRMPEIWQDKEREILSAHDRKMISQGYADSFHTKLTDKLGKVHDVIISNNLFRNHRGEIAGIVGSLQDITEYNRLFRELKNREELFRMIITQSSDVFIIISSLMEISYVSPRIEYLSGYLSEEIQGSIHTYVHPDDFARVSRQIKRLIQRPSLSEEAEFRILKRDGSYLLLEGIAINCLDNPAIRGILITARDISSRKKTELELSRIFRLFTTVLDTSPIFFALLNQEGSIIFANQICTDKTGLPDFIRSRTSVLDLFSHDCREICSKILSETIRTNASSLHDLYIQGKEGIIRLSSVFFPIQEEEELLIGFIGLDITEKEELLIRLDASLSQNVILEQLVRERTEEVTSLLDLKDSLITGIAHELRTPLTPLTALLPLLAEETDYSQKMEIIQVIWNNTLKIANIVEKILHLAKLGTIYRIEDTSFIQIREVVENLLQVYGITAGKKMISIEDEVSPDLYLNTSLPHLVSVLDNIISNAVKYSELGGMVRISGQDLGEEIIISIRDDGIGMSGDELNRIFEPFFKADPSRTDRTSPGLGLSVTKRLIQAIGGDISINSPGSGLGTEAVIRFRKNGSEE